MAQNIGAINSFTVAVNTFMAEKETVIKPFFAITVALIIDYYLGIAARLYQTVMNMISPGSNVAVTEIGVMGTIGVILLISRILVSFIGYSALYSAYPQIFGFVSGNRSEFKLDFSAWKKTIIYWVADFALMLPVMIIIVISLLLTLGTVGLSKLAGQQSTTVALGALAGSLWILLVLTLVAFIYIVIVAIALFYAPCEYFIRKRGIIESIKASAALTFSKPVPTIGLILIRALFAIAVTIVAVIPAICCFVLPVTALVAGLIITPIDTLATMKLWNDLTTKDEVKPKSAVTSI